VKDFEPIGLVAESPMAIVARKDLQQFQGIRCLPVSEQRQDDIRLCRRWVGVASVQPPVLYAINTTVNGAPYKGTAPALNDLLGGHLDFMCDRR